MGSAAQAHTQEAYHPRAVAKNAPLAASVLTLEVRCLEKQVAQLRDKSGYNIQKECCHHRH